MLFNHQTFETLKTPKERAEYLLGCEKAVSMLAKMVDLVPVDIQATVVVLTDGDDAISLNVVAPDDGKEYTEEDLIELANDMLREKVNSYL
ncbi:hypothetical protein VPHD51_0171 [Vibrio phage D51]